MFHAEKIRQNEAVEENKQKTKKQMIKHKLAVKRDIESRANKTIIKRTAHALETITQYEITPSRFEC